MKERIGNTIMSAKAITLFSERIEKQGYQKGQNDLVLAITLLRDGIADSEILKKGVSEETLVLAKTIKA